MKTNIFKKHKRIVLMLVVLTLCFAVIIPGVYAAFSTAYGAMPTYEIPSGVKYQPDYATLSETIDAGNALNEEIMEEGIVMLKNENGTLPFGNDVKNVSVFGYLSVKLTYARSENQVADREPGWQPNKPIYTVPYVLANAGYNVNPVLSDYYTNSVTAEPLAAAYEDNHTLMNSLGFYRDAALIVIGGRSSPASEASLVFSAAELELIDFVTARFDRVVVVINNDMQLDLPQLEENNGIGAALDIGLPGGTGILALGKILNGEVNPSGRLVNTWAVDSTVTPAYADKGGAISGAAQNLSQQTYEEGIYVGYRYWETRAYEMAKAEQAKGAGTSEEDLLANDTYWAWHNDNVVYPFGHGLSYTNFEWELADVFPAKDAVLEDDDEIKVTVKVTNKGYSAGKDVVGLYYTAPYTAGGIEKAFVNLAGFAKTRLLQPGQSQKLTIKLAVRDMSSYDWDDSNNNNAWGRYELDPGKYTIRLMRNSHVRSQEIAVNYTVPAGGYYYDTDSETNAPIANRFTVNDPVTGDAIRFSDGLKKNGTWDMDTANKNRYNTFSDSMTVLSRKDFGASDLETNENLSWPVTMTTEERAATPEMVIELSAATNFRVEADATYTNFYDTASVPWYTGRSVVPDHWTQAPSGTTTDAAITLSEMTEVPFNDPKWDEFINQFTVQELADSYAGAGYGFLAFPRFGVPRFHAQDGAVGLRYGTGSSVDTAGGAYSNIGVLWSSIDRIAATWNEDLMYKQGRMFGNEAYHLEIAGSYCVVLDLARHARAGRGRAEIYTEDPYILGMRSAYHVQGAQSLGLIVNIKHFMGTGNSGNGPQWSTEQTLREINLKAYELAVKKGGALGIMTGYTRLGRIHTAQNYSLTQSILKDEWGFEGYVVTDHMNMTNTDGGNGDLAIRSGIDSLMGGTRSVTAPYWDASLRSDTTGKGGVRLVDGDGNVSNIHWSSLREAAKRNMFAASRSNILSNLVIPNAASGAVPSGITAPSTWKGTTLPAARMHSGEIATGGVGTGGPSSGAVWAAITTDISVAVYDSGAATASISEEINALSDAELKALEPSFNDALTGRDLTNERTRVRNILIAAKTTEAINELQLQYFGRTGVNVSYRLTSDSELPLGLTFNTVTGRIQGHLRETRPEPFVLKVELVMDGAVRGTETFLLPTVSAFSIDDVGMENYLSATKGKEYSQKIVATPNGTTAHLQWEAEFQTVENTGANPDGTQTGRRVVYSMHDGMLPAGLTLASDGTISGTPTQAGQYTFTILAMHEAYHAMRNQFIRYTDYYITTTIVVSAEDISSGTNGDAWSFGTTAPATSEGADGDLYLNFSNSTVYKKISGVWVSQGVITGTGSGGTQGPAGADGSSMLYGNVDPAAATGVNGDLYLNSATWDIFAKADGAWSKLGNIKGADGATGAPGSAGTLVAHIRINTETGNWEVSDDGVTWEDTTVKAQGPAGSPGADGEDGAKGDKGDKGDAAENSGCGSTVAGTSIVFGLALVSLAAVIIVKRKAKKD